VICVPFDHVVNRILRISWHASQRGPITPPPGRKRADDIAAVSAVFMFHWKCRHRRNHRDYHAAANPTFG